MLTPFSQTVITIASFCNLSHCCLQGPFCSKTAVALLPASLVVLNLWPDWMHPVTNLSAFLRFSDLQELDLACGLLEELDDSAAATADLFLDAAFANLTHLKIWDSICCQPVPGFVMSACVPNLLIFKGKIVAHHQGIELAQRIVALPKLQALNLGFYDGDSPDVSLVIPRGSLICALELKGPKFYPKLSVKLEKHGIAYLHSQSCTVQSVLPIQP